MPVMSGVKLIWTTLHRVLDEHTSGRTVPTPNPNPTCFVNVTRLYILFFSLSFSVEDLEKRPCLRWEVHSAAEFRIKMPRLLSIATMLATLLVVAILAVELGDCGSIANRYVAVGKPDGKPKTTK